MIVKKGGRGQRRNQAKERNETRQIRDGKRYSSDTAELIEDLAKVRKAHHIAKRVAEKRGEKAARTQK